MSIVYYGSLVTPVDLRTVDILVNALIAVSSDGKIAWLERDVQSSVVQDVLLQHSWQDVEVIQLLSGEWIMPGFVDTHTHAPQVAVVSC